MKRVGVVLVNWNGLEDTVACVESLRRQTGVTLQVFVVENGSTPSQADALRAHCPECFVLDAGANLGFAGGNNIGVRAALDAGVDYVFLLNNDTEIHQLDAIERLVQLAEKHPGSIVGPKIVYHSEPDAVWYGGGRLDLKKAEAEHVPIEGPASQLTGTVETEFVTGCALLAPASLFRDAGLVEESYFLYFEDVDWNLRAREKGARAFLDLDVVVLHKVSRSVKKGGSLDFYYLIRNKLLFARRFSGASYWTRVLPRTSLTAAWLIAHDVKHRDWKRAGLVARALRDAALHRTGRLAS